MRIDWISREGLEAWARAVLAKYPRADIDLFILRLMNPNGNWQTARGLLQ